MSDDQSMPEQATENTDTTSIAEQKNTPETVTANFDKLNDDSSQAPSANLDQLDIILDIPVTLSVEIGRTRMNIRNLLQLNQGSVVELDRLAGEELDVMINGTLIAHGEVVVVNDKFGIRLNDVVSKSERIKRLQ